MAYFNSQDKRLKKALERFEIKAWSFSTLEMWRDSPARGLMKALDLPGDPVGVAAIVGNATERGIELALTGTPLDVAIDLGNEMLTEFMSFEDPDDIADLTKKTAQRITTGYDKLKEFGVPKCQVKIEYQPDWSPIPILGYQDFVFEDHGLVVDCKAPGKKPSACRRREAAQALVAPASQRSFSAADAPRSKLALSTCRWRSRRVM